MWNAFVFVVSVFRRSEGQSLVEYVLIISLVSILLIAGLQTFQISLSAWYQVIVAVL